MDLTIILTIGKYALLIVIYAFVLVVFRGIIKQLAMESKRGREAAAGAIAGGSVVSRRIRPAPGPRPASRQPSELSSSKPESLPPPMVEPASPPMPEPPLRRASRINLLAEPEEIVEARPMPPSEEEAPIEPEPPFVSAAAPMPAAGAPHLLVLESIDDALKPGDSIALSAAVTIGRSAENSLQVPDRFISSRHALICLRDGRRILVDRGSTNGTFVNGARVDEEVELSDGDRIAFGNTVVEYHAG